MVLQRSSKQAASVGQAMPCQFQVALVRAAGRYQAHSYGVSGSLQDGGLQVIPSERFYPTSLEEGYLKTGGKPKTDLTAPPCIPAKPAVAISGSLPPRRQTRLFAI
ncbi:hypothetical protein A7P94_08015 [Eikenella sp. NML01-A-086]|nr:hypothetical protein A7P94_08015 [Eikenella sp. NML01-A-086]OAM41906.1 hypothetical protein A7Q02_04205 [Eikenella sp. NML97-A-109]